MGSFSLATYTLRIYKHNDNHPLNLDKFTHHKDFLEILIEYIREMSQHISIIEDDSTLTQIGQYYQKDRTISGFFLKGEYGIESELFDIENFKISYMRNANDAEMLPFYFLFIIPNHSDEGFLALQRAGVSGVKTTFESSLTNFFQNRFSDIRIEINKLIPEQLLDQYFNRGRVTKIRFVKFGIPRDITDRINLGHEENEGMTELVVKAKKGRTFAIRERIREVFEGKRGVQEFVELRQFDYDSVKIELNIGGKYRTINLGNPDHLRSEYDITNEIETQGGSPIFESIDSVARRLMTDILFNIGFGDDNV